MCWIAKPFVLPLHMFGNTKVKTKNCQTLIFKARKKCDCESRPSGVSAASRFVCVCVCFCVPLYLMLHENPDRSETSVRELPKKNEKSSKTVLKTTYNVSKIPPKITPKILRKSSTLHPVLAPLWLPFGSLLAYFGLYLAPFGVHFGEPWRQFGVLGRLRESVREFPPNFIDFELPLDSIFTPLFMTNRHFFQ